MNAFIKHHPNIHDERNISNIINSNTHELECNNNKNLLINWTCNKRATESLPQLKPLKLELVNHHNALTNFIQFFSIFFFIHFNSILDSFTMRSQN